MQLKSLSSALVLMPLLAYLTLTPAGAAPKAPEFKIKGSQVNVTTGVTAEIESQLKLAGGITKVVVKDIADADLEKIVAIFPNVDEFTIEESKQITSLKPLAALGKLTKLSVVTPNVADVTPLAGLTGLTKLALNSKMQDLKWMSQLTRLNQITLNSGDLVSLEGLPELTNLKNLDIYNAHPQDLGILAKVVPNLTNLKLTGCVIDDLTPLTGLGKLNYLSLYGVTVTDFTPLSKMPALKTLNYYATKGSNYDTLGTLTQVTKFEGGLTKLADIAFLKNLPNLKSMVLFAEYVRDYGPLADTKLEYLKIWSMHEAIDLVPVGKIGTLKELVFWSPENCTGSKELTGLKSLQKLTVNDYNKKSHAEPFDLSAAASWSELKELSAQQSELANFDALAACTKLERVSLSKVTGVSGLDALKKLPALKSVTVTKGMFPDTALEGFDPKVKINLR